MNKNYFRLTLAAAMALVLVLSGASCSKKTVNPSEMDFTYLVKDKAALNEFWRKDTPYVVVDMTKDNQFLPQEIKVPAGRSIMWQNSDRKEHIVVADDPKWTRRDVGINSSGDGGLISSHISPKAAWRWQIPKDAKSGTKIYYHCAEYGTTGDGKNYGTGMVGLIVVK